MNNDALILRRRLKRLGQGALQCREVELRLAEDGSHVLLSRYVERYCHGQEGGGVSRHHRVSLARLIRWMTEHGEQVGA